MIHLQSNNKQQVVTDGNPYLCEDCILGRPIERLDVQVLLDPFEERFDSPALSVQFRNGNCFKREVIRQRLMHYVLSKGHITFVHQVVSTYFYRQAVHSQSIMYIARSKHDEVWYVVLYINQSVHLESTFVMMELRPWTELQTQVDGTAVKGIHHIVNAQPIVFIFIQDFSPLDKYHCIVLIDSPVILLDHAGYSGLGHHLQTSMIQLRVESSQLDLYTTEACAACQLSITHDKELVTAGESSCIPLYT